MIKIKEKIISLRKLFLSETPAMYKYLQVFSVAIAAVPMYYSSLPAQFQSSIPDSWLKYITTIGAICAFLLQFKTHKMPEEDHVENDIEEKPAEDVNIKANKAE